jgi:hypothetical protein
VCCNSQGSDLRPRRTLTHTPEHLVDTWAAAQVSRPKRSGLAPGRRGASPRRSARARGSASSAQVWRASEEPEALARGDTQLGSSTTSASRPRRHLVGDRVAASVVAGGRMGNNVSQERAGRRGEERTAMSKDRGADTCRVLQHPTLSPSPSKIGRNPRGARRGRAGISLSGARFRVGWQAPQPYRAAGAAALQGHPRTPRCGAPLQMPNSLIL